MEFGIFYHRMKSTGLERVSGVSSTRVLTGANTKFTTDCYAGQIIYIEDTTPLYLVVEGISSDTSMTVQSLSTNFTSKKAWYNWSKYLIEMSEIQRHIESDVPGEAGIIPYDVATCSFYARGNCVENMMNDTTNLENATRHMFWVKAYLGGLEPIDDMIHYPSYMEEDAHIITATVSPFEYGDMPVSMYIGMMDISTLTYSEYVSDETTTYACSFDIVDMLSALNVITNNNARDSFETANIGTNTIAIAGTAALPVITMFEGSSVIDCREIVSAGEIIKIKPEIEAEEDKYFFVTAAELVEIEGFDRLLMAGITINDDIRGDGYDDDRFSVSVDSFFASPMCLYKNLTPDWGGSAVPTVYALDGLVILKKIISSVWADITFSNRMKDSEGNTITVFPISPYYVYDLMYNTPFGYTPLEAVSFLAKTMNIYIYIDSLGQCVLQNTVSLSTTTTNTIPTGDITKISRNFFWDKLIDGVQCTVETWSELTGTAEVRKQPNLEPRNKLDITAFVNDEIAHTQDDFDEYAEEVAQAYLDFYGARHTSYNVEMILTPDSLEWGVLDVYILNEKKYFITSITTDLITDSMSFQMVSLDTYSYSFSNVSPIRR